MTTVLGIDPGATGALALLNAVAGTLTILDMPTWQQTIGKKRRARIDAVELMNYLHLLKGMGAQVALIEQVGGRPRQSASAAFTFGYGFGLLYMGCINVGLPIETVPPMTWKRLMRCPKEGEGIARRADELFPSYRPLFRGPRGGVMDGRAEAAILALFGAQHMSLQLKADVEARIAYQLAGLPG